MVQFARSRLGQRNAGERDRQYRMAQCDRDMSAVTTQVPDPSAGAQSRPGRRITFEPWAVVALTLVAAAIRFADTTSRTYWLDEGFTLYRVLGSWSDLALNRIELQGMSTTDIHPQLYFAALKLWGLAGGLSEFSLRSFSLLCAVLLVPMTYVMSRRAFGARAGLLSALLVVLSPAYQWYGWEVRMYSLTPLLAGFTTYLLVRALGGPLAGDDDR